MVEDGVTGFVRNPFDVPAFAGAIGALLDDPALRERFGRAGRERLRQFFRIERLTEEFLEEYEFARAAARSRGQGIRSRS